MDTDAKGQLGGIECSRDARERMAKDSGVWKCAACGQCNADIMKKREALVQETEEKEGKVKEEVVVPGELRLAYRDELGEKEEVDKLSATTGAATPANDGASSSDVVPAQTTAAMSTAAPVSAPVPVAASAPVQIPMRAAPPLRTQQAARPSPENPLAWIDTCIYGVVAALLFMVFKKLV